jgi:hypothetical protein
MLNESMYHDVPVYMHRWVFFVIQKLIKRQLVEKITRYINKSIHQSVNQAMNQGLEKLILINK